MIDPREVAPATHSFADALRIKLVDNSKLPVLYDNGARARLTQIKMR